jgi:hypothetical protein
LGHFISNYSPSFYCHRCLCWFSVHSLPGLFFVCLSLFGLSIAIYPLSFHILLSFTHDTHSYLTPWAIIFIEKL